MLLKEVEKNQERTPEMISIITTVYKEPFSEIKRCIDSIKRQTNQHWEQIIVFDTLEHPDYDKVLDYVLGEPRIKVIKQENQGACAARNAGYLKSQGEYLQIISSDFEVADGSFVNILDAFNNNKDCGFIYSGYSLFKRDNYSGGVYKSEEFDPFALEQRNYIDGGCVTKYDNTPMWDTSFKALNDWDFALTMVKEYNVKGFYMKDFMMYTAEAPKVGGLSEYSHSHWNQIYEKLCKKHKIKVPKVNVISFGAEFHAKKLAQKFGWHYNNLVSNKTYNYERIHVLGCYISAIPGILQCMYHNPKSKFSLHFIGTDIKQLFEETSHKTILEMKKDFFNRFTNLYSECKRTQSLLREIGIITEVLPLPVDKPNNSNTLINEFTTAIYLPNTTPDKYSMNLMFRLFQTLPNFKFLVFGGNYQDDTRLPNVKFKPWVPIEEVIDESSCLLRITPNDGLAISAIEFLLCNKPVIHNHKLEGCNFISTGNYLNSPSAFHNALNDIINMLYKTKKNSKIKKDFDSSIYSKDYFLVKFLGGK